MLSRVRIRVFLVISLPITLDFIFESYIKLILNLILIFRSLCVRKILPNSLVDLSMNLDPNYVIFDFVDTSSSCLFKNIKILNFSPRFIV